MELTDQLHTRAENSRCISKKILALIVIIFAASALPPKIRAQSFAEWFQQKSTQKKYLLQQIAALQVYATYYRAGNSIAHNGLGSIEGYLKSETVLHTTYYSNLNDVNPVVKHSKKVNDILQWQKDILSLINSLNTVDYLNDAEKRYFSKVRNALLEDCDQQITDLQNLISDSKLKMSDGERLKHIGLIHNAMQNNYSFVFKFTNQVKLYAVQRLRENINVSTEKEIYAIQ